jgi:hypothetical protein
MASLSIALVVGASIRPCAFVRQPLTVWQCVSAAQDATFIVFDRLQRRNRLSSMLKRSRNTPWRCVSSCGFFPTVPMHRSRS